MKILNIIIFLSLAVLITGCSQINFEHQTMKESNQNLFQNNYNKNDNLELPTVAIITTGGTIAEKTSSAGAAVPSVSGDDLINAVPTLKKIANIRVIQFSNIDSSQMTPEIWYNLSKKTDEILKDPSIKGAVITHGTDTMAEGAYFLDLTLESKKPVVFTGAMRDASDLSADGPINIQNAVLQASSEEAKDFGVTVTLNQYINSAKNVRKTETTNVQTFDSGEKGYLGYIAMNKVIKFNEKPALIKFSLPEKLAKVDLLQSYAGDDGKFIRYSADNGAEGIVVEGVGAGNVNSEVDDAINYALSKGVIVVITTRVENGAVYPIYGDKGGGASLQKAGVILGGDLTAAKARILLMLALPHTKDKTELEKYFD